MKYQRGLCSGVLLSLGRMARRGASSWTVAVIVMASVTTGCGGQTTSTGTVTGSGGSGGDSGVSKAHGSGGSATGGTGAGIGTGGAPCTCPGALACGPGFRSVKTISGPCTCGGCESCGTVFCPAGPACGPGQQPVTPPGECCATSCGPADAGGTSGTTDAGNPCQLKSPPPCGPVVCDWSTAVARYCAQAVNGSPVRCGSYNAIYWLQAGTLNRWHAYYDDSGKPAGFDKQGWEVLGGSHIMHLYSCEAYTPFFAAPDEGSCTPLSVKCPTDAGTDGGSKP
jgi:hypothetical protein